MKIDLNTALIIIAAVVIILVLKGGGKPNTDAVKAKDETIKIIQEQRDTYRVERDSAVAQLLRKDSEDKVKYQNTVIKYEKVPVYIRTLNNEDLRRAVENY